MTIIVNKRIGDWMQTFTSRAFWPLDPRPEEVYIEDIAHALAMDCRFGGHAKVHYSVAEHCVRASRLVEAKGFELTVLLHDASEAYLRDVIRPLKRLPFMDEYREIEKRLEAVIEQRFNLLPGALRSPQVKACDEIILATEMRDVMGEAPRDWHLAASPNVAVIKPWNDWRRAEIEFLSAFKEYR